MDAWFGPFFIACLLLGAAGVAKAIDPTMTVGALRGVGLRVPNRAVRAVGGVEAALSFAAILTGDSILAILVAASYLAFTGFVAIALFRHLPIGSCGCFGKVDTPPSGLHVLVNLGAVVASVGMAVGHGRGLVTVLAHQPLAGIPFLVLGAVGTYAAFTALTILPTMIRVPRSRVDAR